MLEEISPIDNQNFTFWFLLPELASSLFGNAVEMLCAFKHKRAHCRFNTNAKQCQIPLQKMCRALFVYIRLLRLKIYFLLRSLIELIKSYFSDMVSVKANTDASCQSPLFNSAIRFECKYDERCCFYGKVKALIRK